MHNNDIVSVSFPGTFGGTEMPFRVQAIVEARDDGADIAGDRLVDTAGEEGRRLALRLPEFPACTVLPATVTQGGLARVRATGLVPNRSVQAVLGGATVAGGTSDASGKAVIGFRVAQTAGPGRRLVSVGVDGTALTADCIVRIEAGPAGPAHSASGPDSGRSRSLSLLQDTRRSGSRTRCHPANGKSSSCNDSAW